MQCVNQEWDVCSLRQPMSFCVFKRWNLILSTKQFPRFVSKYNFLDIEQRGQRLSWESWQMHLSII
jgi:hypothetical protein